MAAGANRDGEHAPCESRKKHGEDLSELAALGVGCAVAGHKKCPLNVLHKCGICLAELKLRDRVALVMLILWPLGSVHSGLFSQRAMSKTRVSQPKVPSRHTPQMCKVTADGQ